MCGIKYYFLFSIIKSLYVIVSSSSPSMIRWNVESSDYHGKWNWIEGSYKVPEVTINRRSPLKEYLLMHPHLKKRIYFKRYTLGSCMKIRKTIILIAGGPGQSGDIWHSDIVENSFNSIIDGIECSSIITLDHRGIVGSGGGGSGGSGSADHISSAHSSAMASRDIILLSKELKKEGSSSIFLMGTSYGGYVVEGVLELLGGGGGGNIIDGVVIDSPSRRKGRFDELEVKEERFWFNLLNGYHGSISATDIMESYNKALRKNPYNRCKKTFEEQYGSRNNKGYFINSLLKQSILQGNGSLIELVIAFIIWMDKCPNVEKFNKIVLKPILRLIGDHATMEGMIRDPEYLENSLNKHIICSELCDLPKNQILPYSCERRNFDLFGQCSMYAAYYQMSNGIAKYDWRMEWKLVYESLNYFPYTRIPKIYLHGNLDLITPPTPHQSSPEIMILKYKFYGHNLLPEGPCLRKAFKWLMDGNHPRYYGETEECISSINRKSFIKWEILPYLLKGL